MTRPSIGERTVSTRLGGDVVHDDGPLRIAFLVYRGNPYCGGQGVYTRYLTGQLARLGHHVTVFSGQPYPDLVDGVDLVRLPSLDLYRDTDPFRRPRAREIESAADLVELTTMFCGGFPEPRTFSIRAHAALRRRLGAFDIVHDDQCLGTGLLKMLDDGWPVIASVHHPVTVDRRLDIDHAADRATASSLRRWYRFAAMQGRVARRLPALLTVSQRARDDIVSEMGVSPAKIHVVPVGVDTARYRPLPHTVRIKDRILTTASADIPLKGLLPLIEALAKLRTERPDAHLVVVGTLRAHSPVGAAIERFGLTGAVEFVGGISDDDIVRHYASCAVAVVPSLYEGFSLPAAEAMSCAAPLVVTTGGALPEVVGADGRTARQVPPGDADALWHALADVLGDPAAAAELGAAGRARVEAQFTWERCALGTVEHYRALVRGRPAC